MEDGWEKGRQRQSHLSSTLNNLHIKSSANFTKLANFQAFNMNDDEDGTPQFPPIATSSFLEAQRTQMSSLEDRQGQNFNNIFNESGAGLLSQGFSMTTTIKAVRTEQAQVFNSSRFSSSIQNQGVIPTSNSWMNMNMNIQQKGVKEITSSIVGSTTKSAAEVGIIRSFSSTSGFPLSSGPLRSNENDDNEFPLTKNLTNGMLAFDSSPMKRNNFGFRNFDRPLWKDLPQNIKNYHSRMTWDPSTMQSMGSCNSQTMQFCSSQRTVFDSFSSFKTVEDHKIFLRQSYGASESESDDDDDVIKSITYEQRPALPYQQKLAIEDKPYDAASEISDDNSSIAPFDQSPRNSVIGSECQSTPEHKRCYKVAQELLTTERTYVKILQLIDQVFHFRVDQENRQQSMFPNDTVTQMFCNIKSLYQLHHDHLLPLLETRLKNWEEDPRIGDIMKDFAPFLKMYSEYVQNFDNSINLINVYREKNTRFANIVNEVQKKEECGNLPIQHHLIGPIQRIPRYRLLLEAYLRKLPDDSNDKKDAEKALEIVSKAAEHANEAMRRIVGFKKLLEIQENVKGAVDLVSPTRILLKEGKISKISARTGDHQERYLFLLSDMVLLCSMRPMANRMISSSPYQLRAQLNVASINVNEGDDLEIINTFYIEDNRKKIELYTATAIEKQNWMKAMYDAREDLLERKSSLRLSPHTPAEDELGIKQPAKIKSDSVSKCMECHLSFTMLKRKHHCHACGSVVCAKCSDSKVALQYAGGKSCRVCKACKAVFEAKDITEKNDCDSEPLTPEEPLENIRGVLDVPGAAPSVLSGYLNLRLRGKKEWITRWFALRSDFVLYCYEKEGDEKAMTATPIPGMAVIMAEDLPKSDTCNIPVSDKERVFRIAHGHGRKYFIFQAANREEALLWLNRLQMAGKAELSSASNTNINANNQP